MKKIYLLSLALITALLTTSCEDFLTEDVRGQENLDTYFSNEEEAEKFITGCYASITYDDWWQIDNFWILADMCSDDYWMGNCTQSQDGYIQLAHYQGTGQENGTISNFWQYRYKGILRCNVAIDRIPQANIYDEQKKARLIAEAKFLRAYYYFELVKNFGGVPLMTGFLMPHEVSGITRASVDEVYEFIWKDLREAIDILPSKKEQAAADLGRATRGAALGLHGKTLVFREKWAAAKDTLGLLIQENEYKLMDNFGDVWNVDHNNNAESLFEVQYMYSDRYALGGCLSIISGPRDVADQDGWAWGLPTANLENAFIEAGDTERLRWTIIKNGATEIAGEDNFAGLIAKQGNANGNGTYCIPPRSNKSARISRKFYIPFDKRPEKFEKCRIPLNHRILRLADIYLLYAEACNELGQDGEACIYLNKVRNRAKLGDLNLTGWDLRKAIRLERRLELALESQRLDDIRRWTDENGKKVICNLMGPEGSFVKWNTDPATADPIEWAQQYESSDKGIGFREDRDMVFPIPLYEITISNGLIEQNPGWN